MSKEKSRFFTFLLYPSTIRDDWKISLESLGLPIAVSPLHDKDLSKVEGVKFARPHYHVIYVANNPVTADSVRLKVQKVLGSEAVAKVQIVVRSLMSMYLYLTHESKDAIAKKKHIYSKDDILRLNNFDIERYISLGVEDKEEILNSVCDLIDVHGLANIRELRRFLVVSGSDYGLTINTVNKVIRSHTGIIRLYFDAVYQERKYPNNRVVNIETGELMNE